MQRGHAQLDRPLVHLDHRRPFAAVAFFNRLLEVIRRGLRVDNRRQLKERRLHQHIKAPAQPELAGDIHGVKGIKMDIFPRQIAFKADRQMLLQLRIGPAAVE